jgi:hypothetical protein
MNSVAASRSGRGPVESTNIGVLPTARMADPIPTARAKSSVPRTYMPTTSPTAASTGTM